MEITLQDIFDAHVIDSNDEPWDESNLNKLIDLDAIIHWVSRYGTAQELEVLIRAGANIDLQGDIGRTPIAEAANFENLDCLRLLIKSGANAKLTDDCGDSAISLAKGKCREEIETYIKNSS